MAAPGVAALSGDISQQDLAVALELADLPDVEDDNSLEASQEAVDKLPPSQPDAATDVVDGEEFLPTCVQCVQQIIDEADRVCVHDSWFHKACLGLRVWFERLAKSRGEDASVNIFKLEFPVLYNYMILDVQSSLAAISVSMPGAENLVRRGRLQRQMAASMLNTICDCIQRVQTTESAIELLNIMIGI